MSLNRISFNAFNVLKLNSRLNVRNISITHSKRDIFKVQDEDDWKERVINNKNVVLVDFYATWCGPCKALTPRLETIVASKQGKIDLAEVDVDTNETIASQYQITTVPTVLALSNGKIVDQFIGLRDEDQLRAFVGKVLNE